MPNGNPKPEGVSLMPAILRPCFVTMGRVSDRSRSSSQPLAPTRVLARVQTDPRFASTRRSRSSPTRRRVATCIFVGTVRDHSDAGEVQGLEYEAWDDLAVRRLEEIAAEASAAWPLRAVAIVHRTGSLQVG